MDIYFFILFSVPSLTFNYSIFVYLVTLLLSYICSRIYFIFKIKKIHKQLSNQPEVTNVQEYIESLNFGRKPLKAMMYIVVGLASLSDYFIDGSLIDYVINSGTLDSALSILLQIVTFFPYESRKLEVLFKHVVKKRKMGIIDRFLIYQVYGIKMRRLVSDSKDTLELFNKLKAKNDGCKSIIHGFWDKQQSNNSFLSSLSIMVNDIDSLFKASLLSNPNNLRLTNEYSNFLTECKCDFDNAVRESIRAESIGDGHNFNVDISFRSLVIKFPRYLKDKILDTKGRRIRKNENQKGSSSKESKSSSSNSRESTGSFSVDIERQEVVCKKILRDSKVRLAFHHSIADTHPPQYNLIIVNLIFDVSVIIFFYIGFLLYSRSTMSWRRSSYKDIQYSGYSVFYDVYANVYTSSTFAKDTGRYNDSSPILGNISIDDGNIIALVPVQLTLPQKTYFCLNLSRDYLKWFLNDVVELAQQNIDPYEIAEVFLVQDSGYVVCGGASPNYWIPASLKEQIIVQNFMQNTLAGLYSTGTHFPNIYLSNDYCQVISNLPAMSGNANKAFDAILKFNIKKADANQKTILYWMIGGAVAIFFTVSIPAMFIINTYNAMVDKLIKVLLALPSAVKEDSKKPLMINTDNSQESVSNAKLEASHIMDILPIFFFIFLFGCVGNYCAFAWSAMKLNKDITKILRWFYYSCTRITMSSQIGNNVIQIILLNGSLPNNVTTREKLMNQASSDLQNLVETNKALLYGNDEVAGCIGFDEKLDDMQLHNQCDLGRSPNTIHDMYACTGLDQQIQIFKNMVNEVLKKPDSFNGQLNDEISSNIAHNLRFHLYPNVIKATKRISDIMESTYDAGMQMQIVFMAIGFICLLVIFTLPWFFRYFVIQNYKNLLMLLQHMPPQSILDTPEILEFFTGKKKASENEHMSTSKSIIHDTSECIIITNQNNIIEIINKSVTDNIGLTPDQMLGQHIVNFVSANEQARFNNQIDLMMSGQGSAFWEDHIELVNDSNQSIPFSIQMIGMKDNDETEIKSIVFILTNETEEIEKRKAAEQAKAKSEKLLYQILPKDIVVRLNRGEIDISFSIPSATIFFVDIVKFSAYAETLTPSEIMANLSLVFATFDKIVAEYESITKIKLIGDVYMAAAGLFQGEDDPSTKHAEDAVRCCLSISKSMEEINMKLNASLEVRIGVNSGGPLIGGVLGSDKPTFDIIGDPINVAARLQSTDIPGNVQISSDTKELIENLDFSIEERGEIYLKGKGNRLTYFVSLPAKHDNELASFSMTLSAKENL